MALDKPSVVSRVKQLQTLEKIREDAEFSGFTRNLLPLTGRVGQTRRKKATLGQGSFGRVNLEEFNEGNVATKYFLETDNTLSENIAEIATLRFLQGRPNVAQLIRVTLKGTNERNLNFPAILMGKARTTLDNESIYTSWESTYSAIVQVLRGYYTLHSLGITHRDTKPHNMLLTNLGEVWITDFGASKYIGNYYPQSKDAYTGTYWYAAPELLMKNQLRKEENDFLKSDAWAVGASIAHILRQRAAFMGEDKNDVLDYIFAVKGTPDASDGETYTLYNELNSLHPFKTYPKVADPIRGRILLHSVHKPSDPAILERVADIVAGLLDYDPKKRFTIKQAIEMLPSNNRLPDLEPEPLLTNQYIIADPLPKVIDEKSIDNVFGWIHNIVNSSIYEFDPLSKPFVLDRTGVYLMAFLQKKNAPSPKYLKLYAAVALLIATSLFDASPFQKYAHFNSLRSLPNFPYTKSEVMRCIREYMMVDIEFHGKTFLDIVLESLSDVTQEDVTQEDIQSYGMLNYLCFQKSLFRYYSTSLDLLQETFIYLIEEEETVPLKRYFNENYTIGLADKTKNEMKAAVNWMTPAAGGRRRSKKRTRRVKKRRQNTTLKARNG